jgi:hypothetical protein
MAASRAASRFVAARAVGAPAVGLAELAEGEVDGDRGGGAGGRAGLPVADLGHGDGQRREQGQQQPTDGAGTDRKGGMGEAPYGELDGRDPQRIDRQEATL